MTEGYNTLVQARSYVTQELHVMTYKELESVMYSARGRYIQLLCMVRV